MKAKAHKEMRRSLVLTALYLLGVIFFDRLEIRLFCAFAMGVNFEAYLVSWRVRDDRELF